MLNRFHASIVDNITHEKTIWNNKMNKMLIKMSRKVSLLWFS